MKTNADDVMTRPDRVLNHEKAVIKMLVDEFKDIVKNMDTTTTDYLDWYDLALYNIFNQANAITKEIRNYKIKKLKE
jgi:hypothetical protein